MEDDVATREALHRVLVEEGCDVEMAVDGEKAIGRLAQTRSDAIVLDIVLPKLSGTDVMEYLASTRPETLASIIVVTGLDVMEIRKLFPTVCETLSKPVIPARLLGSVRRCLHVSSQSGSGAAGASVA
ncbi:MAG TPA: response regulator [Thermoanaerobaculia bacterium]|nr:response regulator [Thermoanaerobaculia bacterium]